MSLYYEVADILTNSQNVGGSLKSRVFNRKDFKNPPVKLYALAVEATKWSVVLKEVVERAGLLSQERKLTPILGLLLTHDLLLSKKGVAAPAGHVLNAAISKHKSRLGAELTRIRIRKGFRDIEHLRAWVNSGSADEAAANGDDTARSVRLKPQHPRWIRINTLKTSSHTALQRDFAGHKLTTQPAGLLGSSSGEIVVRRDDNIPDLFAVAKNYDAINTTAYKEGRFILQDKASCFPAYLLDPSSIEGDIIDACSAPGNKTTHLAALLHTTVQSKAQQGKSNSTNGATTRRIFAFERDRNRSKILRSMVQKAGADIIVKVYGNTDFLTTKPDDVAFANVEALLLDPSCSGSGIVGRDDGPKLELPAAVSSFDSKSDERSTHKSGKKRKRGQSGPTPQQKSPKDTPAPSQGETEETEVLPSDGDDLQGRLMTLSNFQLRLVCHAMSFPSARRITYSTCSIHTIENEAVVLRALSSPVARSRGWRVLRRVEQVVGLRNWAKRGNGNDIQSVVQELNVNEDLDDDFTCTVLEACIRCEQGTDEGTMGFFVAGFVRDPPESKDRSRGESNQAAHSASLTTEEEEWNGFTSE